MIKLVWLAFNIWSIKKTFDLMQENAALKQENDCKNITIRTLARQVSVEPPTVPVESQD